MNTGRSLVIAFGLGLVMSLFGMVFMLTQPVSAATPVSALSLPGLQAEETPVPAATPAATPTPTPTPGLTITENIFHIISFPFETMTDAVVQMSNKILQQFYKDAEWIYGEALDKTIFGDFGIAPNNLEATTLTPLFTNIIQPHWNVTFTLALLLLPATLTLTAVGAMRLGVTSALGVTDLKEALLGWVIAAGAAAASFYLLGLAHRLSLSAAQAILLADFGEQVSGATLAQAFFNAAALSAITALWPLPALYVGFFAVFLATSIILGLGLALAAYTALVYLLSAIAPLVITLGVLPPLRWLNALWIKATTVVFLLPVTDALLLKAALSLYQGFFDPNQGGDLFGFIASLFIIAGVLSTLIVINFKVGEMVFGALAEIHHQAWGATMGVVQMVMTVAGFALGGLAVGVGAGASASAGAGSEAATASASPAATTGGGVAASGEVPSSMSSSATTTGGLSTVGRQRSSGVASNPGLGQRIAEIARVMSSRLSGARAKSTLSEADSSPGNDEARTESRLDDNGTTPQSDSLAEDATQRDPSADGEVKPQPESATDEGAIQHPSMQSTGDPEAQMRRARLTEGFGRVLTLGTRNPVLRGLGTGLQASGALGQYQAGQALDEQRATETQAEQEARYQHTLSDGAMRWSEKNLSNAPNDLFDLGRDNTALMAGGLHQAFVNRGLATRMDDVLTATQQSYGQWVTQGRTGGLTAQREMFDTVMDEQNKTSPEAFVEAYQALASKHQFQLGDEFASSVRQVYEKSREIGLGGLPSEDTVR